MISNSFRMLFLLIWRDSNPGLLFLMGIRCPGQKERYLKTAKILYKTFR
jgi:hypothetical protein